MMYCQFNKEVLKKGVRQWTKGSKTNSFFKLFIHLKIVLEVENN